MTDHSDLIEQIQAAAEITGDELLQAAASALSSQYLSLSEAREEIERLKGLVAGIRETPAPAWQPIGTFKGDEAYVLVWDGWHVSEARYHPSEDGWWLANTHPTDAHDGQIYPTHWMPIHAPPSALENGPAVLADAINDPAGPSLSSLRKGAEELDAALLESTAMRHSTGEYYSVEVFFTSFDGSERFRALLSARCARIRSALVSGSREDGDG